MPRRILLHAGFHKTGTSTLQACLRANRAALKPHVALRLRWSMPEVLAAARGYSSTRDPLHLIKVQTRFGRMMQELPGMPRRTLVLSAEELLGHLPGRGKILDYGAAPDLLHAYWEIAKARYPQADVHIFLSTRGSSDWLKSAHWEHVKSSNMTMDLDEFQSRYRAAADLPAIVEAVADRVPAPIHTQALEDCHDLALGPATPLLALCDIPDAVRRTLVSVAPTNAARSDDLRTELLQINRTVPTAKARNAAKAALLSKATSP